MSWLSLNGILLFPISVFICFVLPKRVKCLWLLLVSYLFCWSWGKEAVMALLLMTLICYFSGLGLEWMERESPRFMVLFLTSVSIICLFPLVLYKTAGLLFPDKLNSLLLPAGFSFYSLQAVGYLIGIYRREQKAERRFIYFALFLAFFPKFISGPIEKADHFLKQIDEKTGCFEYVRVKNGLILMLWGYFQKVVIADILVLFVDSVYTEWSSYSGTTILMATVVYAIQLYADFSGYSNIALGAAEILGFRMQINFRQPYFAESIQDFWRRWHISLSLWLKDYIYIPLGGNRKGIIRKDLNIILTFLASGMWHGGNWTFLLWGLLHGLYQVIGERWRKVGKRVVEKMHFNEKNIIYQGVRRCIVFLLIDIAWLFFRADSVGSAFSMLRKCATDIHLGDLRIWQSVLYKEEWFIAGSAVLVLFLIDYFHEKGYKIRDWLSNRHFVIRWSVYSVLTVTVMVAATRQMGGDASQFLYTQF